MIDRFSLLSKIRVILNFQKSKAGLYVHVPYINICGQCNAEVTCALGAVSHVIQHYGSKAEDNNLVRDNFILRILN